jgi:hypothetical protein
MRRTWVDPGRSSGAECNPQANDFSRPHTKRTVVRNFTADQLRSQFVLQTQQGSEHVCVERGCVALRGLVDNAARPTFCSRTVDRHIKSAESADDPLDQLADFFVMSNIGREEDRVGA